MLKINFKNISFKYKIIAVILLVSFFTQFLGAIIYIANDKKNFKETSMHELLLIGDIIANGCVVPILFNDTAEATKVLHSLKSNPYIKKSAIYTTKLKPFAEVNYKTNSKCINPFKVHNDSIIITDSTYILSKPIKDETEHNNIIGYLLICRNLDDYHSQLTQTIVINLVITFILLIFAFIIATQFQKIISKPILRLSTMVKNISQNRDFSLRIVKKGNDEIGQLIEGFNNLLFTIENQNNELIQAKDEALRLAKTKQQFLANMSHEIRTPMNAIMGMIKLLQNTQLNDEQKEYVNNINFSSSNLLTIINDILDISKIESGKIVFEKNLFNLNDILNNIKKMFNPIAFEKKISLQITKSANVPGFWLGDHVRLNQIIINLISNAIKFTSKGSVKLFVDIKKQIDEKNYELLFKIEDTGIGIPSDRKNHIFESFTQASSDTTRKFGGTGLGLTIAKQLVELQKGKIWFESEVNKGSIFYFYIPLEKASPPTINQIKEKADFSLNQNIDKEILAKSTILIAEDNELNQFLIKTLLIKHHFKNILVAKNGKEVIDLLKHNNVDLILMDLHMPEIDGYETTSFIRKNFTGQKQRIPIIALTAAVIDGEKEKCLNTGMNDYISKPYNTDVLIEKILFHLKQNK